MISIEIRGSSATVTMKPYKPRVVEAIRTIRGRRWDARSKTWAIPVSTLQHSVERLVRTGEMVMVNGKEWEGSADTQKAMAADRAAEIQAENAANPLIHLFRQLPEQLRQPVYDALATVLTPAAGGDVQWVVWLDGAYEGVAGRAS
jgi:hypothetical protein